MTPRLLDILLSKLPTDVIDEFDTIIQDEEEDDMRKYNIAMEVLAHPTATNEELHKCDILANKIIEKIN
jgi:hypothetical protein